MVRITYLFLYLGRLSGRVGIEYLRAPFSDFETSEGVGGEVVNLPV